MSCVVRRGSDFIVFNNRKEKESLGNIYKLMLSCENADFQRTLCMYFYRAMAAWSKSSLTSP